MTETSPRPKSPSKDKHGGSPPSNEPLEPQGGNPRTRKRTKTGCLTCRKRRIKCGEERPTCGNCIKSKRPCEGYAPRLTFKDHFSSVNPALASRLGVGIRYPQPGAAGQVSRPPQSSGGSGLPTIAPRPIPLDTQGYRQPHLNSMWTPDTQVMMDQMYPMHQQMMNHSPETIHGQYSALSQPGSAGMVNNGHEHLAFHGNQVSFQGKDAPQQYQQHDFNQAWPSQATSPATSGPHIPQTPLYSTNRTAYLQTSAPPLNDYDTVSAEALTASTSDPWSDSSRSYDDIIANLPTSQSWQYSTEASMPAIHETLAGPPNSVYFDSNRPAEEADDDYYDVETDEEEMINISKESLETHRDVGFMSALEAARYDTAPRSYNTFLDRPDMLANYVPKFTSSPLMDSTAARVFAHYITATAPSLSVFERHPINPSIIFSGKPVPKSHQSLWTYTIPMLALSNQGLLQAVLALASLQICRLQQTPITAAMRHYHLGLRKVAKAVATPSKRSTIATLAATLLLGHYEATTAEHSKWSSHLAGARQLLLEVDFKGISRRIKEMKALYGDQSHMNWYNPYVSPQYLPFPADIPWLPQPGGLDEKIVSQLMGWRVQYDDFGSVIDDHEARKGPLSEKEMENFQTYRDLFWWFCKHDIIQSVISGNRLLLPYDRWVHCSPRAPIGKLDAVYGTMDHILLIVGRVADFANRDRIRKVKMMMATGGQWRPPPDLFTTPPFGPPPGMGGYPPSMPRRPPAGPSGPPGGGPPPGAPGPSPFYGMMPAAPNPPQLPPSFASAPRDQIYTAPPPNEDFDLSSATAEAISEWTEIQSAFELFEQALGASFQPLPPDLALPIQTPFGPALQYRTYHIATIWGYFYTARVIHMRTHPHMPPATLMATGVAAAQTQAWTQLVGRIALGLQSPPDTEELNPTLGSAMTETMLSLFFSGVQYSDPVQRHAVVTRLRLIAERVGVESAALIAVGLERYWGRMADMGRGPAYRATMTPTDDEGVLGRKMRRGGENPTRDGRGGGSAGEGVVERSFVYISQDTKKNWGNGVLGLDQDLGKLDLSG